MNAIKESLFKECCAKETTRFAIEQPFLLGEYLYATNGIVCVRTKSQDGEVNDRAPNPTTLNWQDETEVDALPLPDALPEASSVPCNYCDGKGRDSFDPEFDCSYCDGTGTIISWPILDWGHFKLSSEYVRLVMQFGGEIHANINPHKAAKVVFQDHDSEALIMPISGHGDHGNRKVIDMKAAVTKDTTP